MLPASPPLTDSDRVGPPKAGNNHPPRWFLFREAPHTGERFKCSADERAGALALASLNEIYKLVGELTGAVKAIEGGIREIKQDLAASEETSSNSRAGIHLRLDDIVQRTANLESDMSVTKNKVEGMEKVTVEVTTLHSKAEGAGTLGRWLLRAGIGIVTVAGWIIGAYTYLTGRPPP